MFQWIVIFFNWLFFWFFVRSYHVTMLPCYYLVDSCQRALHFKSYHVTMLPCYHVTMLLPSWQLSTAELTAVSFLRHGNSRGNSRGKSVHKGALFIPSVSITATSLLEINRNKKKNYLIRHYVLKSQQPSYLSFIIIISN